MKRTLLIALVAITMVLSLSLTKANATEPHLSGVAYIQGHGGHIAVIDLATGDMGRIVHGKPSDALELSKDGNIIFTFSLDGYSMEANLAKGTKSKWQRLGKKHCGTATAPDGTIWVSDMKDGYVYVYDPKRHKLKDKFPISKSICGISFSNDGKFAYIADMPGGFINIVNVKTKKVVGKTARIGNFIHRQRLNPAGTELWQSDGSELKAGVAYGVGYAEKFGIPGTIKIIDVATGNLKDTVYVFGNPHDVDFTPDGRYALVVTRQVPEPTDSAIVVVDTHTKRIVKVYSACKKCHGEQGIEIEKKHDKGKAFLCAIQVNWKQTKIPDSKLIEKLEEE